MSNLLKVKRFRRPDQPQMVFVAALSAFVSTAQRWPAVLSGLGLSYRSRAAPPLDVRRVDAPESGWLPLARVADVPKWVANWSHQRTGERTRARLVLDVRTVAQPLFTDQRRVETTALGIWAPVFQGQLAAIRSRALAPLDVRTLPSRTLAWETVYEAPEVPSRVQVGIVSDGATRAILRGWSIDAAANSRAVFTCRIYSSDGSYRPSLDQEIQFTYLGETLFAGIIEDVDESGIGDDPVRPITSTIRATDFNTFAERRHVNITLPLGSLKSKLTRLVDSYLFPEYGITLHPAQADGPTLPALGYPWVKMSDVFSDFTSRTAGEYIGEISVNKVLRFVQPVTNAAPFNITVANKMAKGDVKVKPTRRDYANYIVVKTETLMAIAYDATEIAARKIRSALYAANDPTTQAEVDALASTILARSIVEVKQVQYRTYQSGLRPGMSQSIVLPDRNLNNLFLITNIRISEDSGRIAYDVTAMEGLVYQSGWRETWRSIIGGDRAVAGGTPIGGLPGSTGAVRYIIDLGGSGVEAVTCPAATVWVSATNGAIQKQISTITRGTTSATVTARIRALDAGVSVQARLFNVSTGAATPGTSAIVTSTTYETVTWGTTLTAGSSFYELQILTSIPLSPAQANGFLE